MSLRMMSHLVKGLACIILVMFVYAVLFGWPHVLKKEVTPKTSEDEKPAHYLQEHFWKEDFSADEITSNPLSVDTAQLLTRKPAEGYIVAQRFGNQLSAGVRDIMSLQCLASKIGGVSVIEPWIIESFYGIDMKMAEHHHHTWRFRDLHDIVEWNNFTTSRDYSPLVSVEYFNETIHSSNLKHLILAEYNCEIGSKRALTEGLNFCRIFGLKLVKHVCFNFVKVMELSNFKKHLYSDYKPNEVVVLLHYYGGLRAKVNHEARRVSLSDTECQNCTNDVAFIGLYPSPSVMSDAEKYINKYMNGNLTYISVMVRIEKSLLHTNNLNKWKAESGAMKCVQNVIVRWKKAQEHYGIHRTFLTTDVGLFGSASLRHKHKIAKASKEAVEYLFSVVHNGTLSLSQWEQSFTTIGKGKMKSPAYLAMMQKVVSAKGTVLMTAGGHSTFHESTQTLHQHLHHDPQMISLGEDCS